MNVGRAERDRGALEVEVLRVLAGRGPATPGQVRELLSGDRAYTTVMTTLARLYRKGALTRNRHGRAFAYALVSEPAAVPDAVTARSMRRLLEQGRDRAGVLARFVAELEPGDERLLAELLREAGSEEQAGGASDGGDGAR